MDREQKLNYEKSMENYFHEHKVYNLFQNLFEELVKEKPKDPINYLIERLKRKGTKKIFIVGYPGSEVKTVCVGLSNSLGYTSVNMSSLIEKALSNEEEISQKIKKNFEECRLIDDETMIDLFREQVIKYEEQKISYIIEGFPRTRTQAIFMQSLGLLPDIVILLTTKKEKSEEEIFNKIKENFENNGIQKSDEEIKELAKISVEETLLNLKSLEDVFKSYYRKVNVDEFEQQSDILNNLTNLINFQFKSNENRNPPHIILVAPPCFNKYKIGEMISNQLNITHINIMELLRKEINSKNENSISILNSLEKCDLVDNKYILKLLEDKLYSSECMIKGWIVTGFPKSKLQINYMENMNSEIKPNLIAFIDTDEKKIEENAINIKYDKTNGKIYLEGSKEYSELGGEILERLSKRDEDREEFLKKRIGYWNEVYNIITTKEYKNIVKLDGNETEDKIVETIINSVGFNK
jgi:adenylate kinase